MQFKLVVTWYWPLSSCNGTSPFNIPPPCCFVALEDVFAGNKYMGINPNSNKTRGRPNQKWSNKHFLSSCWLFLFTTRRFYKSCHLFVPQNTTAVISNNMIPTASSKKSRAELLPCQQYHSLQNIIIPENSLVVLKLPHSLTTVLSLQQI